MQKNIKRASAMILSLAMAVQFGLTDSYYVNAIEETEEPQQETAAAKTNEASKDENSIPEENKDDAPTQE